MTTVLCFSDLITNELHKQSHFEISPFSIYSLFVDILFIYIYITHFSHKLNIYQRRLKVHIVYEEIIVYTNKS